MRRAILIIVFTLLNLSRVYGIEAIDNDAEHLYFLDSTIIFQYDLLELKLQKKLNLVNDSDFVNAFYKLKKHQDPDFNKIKKRLQMANYFNLTCYDHKVYVAARFVSLDFLKTGWEYLLIEYTEDLKFKNMYILNEPRSSRYGYVEPSPRFRLQFNTQYEVMLTVSNPPEFKNHQDSIYGFAIFKMDEKKSELRFKNLVAVSTPYPRMKNIIVNNYPKGLISYPLNIPLSFSGHPAYFSFPYVIVNNMKGVKTFDPFHHVKYAIDSSRYFDGNLSNRPLGYHFNTLNTRELILAYTFQDAHLKFLLRNYQNDKNKMVVMNISDGNYHILPLEAPEDLDNIWFHFIADKILAIRKVGNAYVLDFIN